MEPLQTATPPASDTSDKKSQAKAGGYDRLDLNKLYKGKATDSTTANKPPTAKHGLLAIGKALPARGRGGQAEPVQQVVPALQKPPQQQPPPQQVQMQQPPLSNNQMRFHPHHGPGPAPMLGPPSRLIKDDFPALNAEPAPQKAAAGKEPLEEKYGPGPVLRPKAADWSLAHGPLLRPPPPPPPSGQHPHQRGMQRLARPPPPLMQHRPQPGPRFTSIIRTEELDAMDGGANQESGWWNSDEVDYDKQITFEEEEPAAATGMEEHREEARKSPQVESRAVQPLAKPDERRAPPGLPPPARPRQSQSPRERPGRYDEDANWRSEKRAVQLPPRFQNKTQQQQRGEVKPAVKPQNASKSAAQMEDKPDKNVAEQPSSQPIRLLQRPPTTSTSSWADEMECEEEAVAAVPPAPQQRRVYIQQRQVVDIGPAVEVQVEKAAPPVQSPVVPPPVAPVDVVTKSMEVSRLQEKPAAQEKPAIEPREESKPPVHEENKPRVEPPKPRAEAQQHEPRHRVNNKQHPQHGGQRPQHQPQRNSTWKGYGPPTDKSPFARAANNNSEEPPVPSAKEPVSPPSAPPATVPAPAAEKEPPRDKKIPSLMALGELSPPEELVKRQQKTREGTARGQQQQWVRGRGRREFYDKKEYQARGRGHPAPPGNSLDKPRGDQPQEKPSENNHAPPEKPLQQQEKPDGHHAEKPQPPIPKEEKPREQEKSRLPEDKPRPSDKRRNEPRRPPPQKLYDPPHKKGEHKPQQQKEPPSEKGKLAEEPPAAPPSAPTQPPAVSQPSTKPPPSTSATLPPNNSTWSPQPPSTLSSIAPIPKSTLIFENSSFKSAGGALEDDYIQSGVQSRYGPISPHAVQVQAEKIQATRAMWGEEMGASTGGGLSGPPISSAVQQPPIQPPATSSGGLQAQHPASTSTPTNLLLMDIGPFGTAFTTRPNYTTTPSPGINLQVGQGQYQPFPQQQQMAGVMEHHPHGGHHQHHLQAQHLQQQQQQIIRPPILSSSSASPFLTPAAAPQQQQQYGGGGMFYDRRVVGPPQPQLYTQFGQPGAVYMGQQPQHGGKIGGPFMQQQQQPIQPPPLQQQQQHGGGPHQQYYNDSYRHQQQQQFYVPRPQQPPQNLGPIGGKKSIQQQQQQWKPYM